MASCLLSAVLLIDLQLVSPLGPVSRRCSTAGAGGVASFTNTTCAPPLLFPLSRCCSSRDDDDVGRGSVVVVAAVVAVAATAAVVEAAVAAVAAMRCLSSRAFRWSRSIFRSSGEVSSRRTMACRVLRAASFRARSEAFQLVL